MWPVASIATAGLIVGVFAYRSVAGALFTKLPGLLGIPCLAVAIVLATLAIALLWLIAWRRLAPEPGRIAAHHTISLCFLSTLPLLGTFLRSEQDTLFAISLALISVVMGLYLWLLARSKGLAERSMVGALAGSGSPTLKERSPIEVSTEAEPAISSGKLSLAIAIVAALISLATYYVTLAPSVIVGDSSEMQVLAHTLGIPHPTGYPLYTLLGKVFTWLPIADIAFRVSLLSAVLAAGSVAVLAFLTTQVTRQPIAGLLAGLCLAFSRTFWSQAVIAEVYTLQVVIVISILALLTATVQTERPQPGSSNQSLFSAPACFWFLACLAFGLGLAHHRTTVLLAPAMLLAWLFLGKKLVLNPKVLALSLVAALLPTAFYLYFPIRWEAVTSQALTMEQFIWHVTGSGYGSALRLDALMASFDRYEMYGRLAVEQFTYVGLALALLGVIWLARRATKVLLFSFAAYLLTTLFAIAYYVPDVEVFFLGSHAITALWIGLGIMPLLELLRNLMSPSVVKWTERYTPLLLMLPALLLTLNWPLVDRSEDWQAHDWGKRVLSYGVEQNALVIADVDKLSPLRYFLNVEQANLRAEAIMPDTEAQTWDIIANALGTGRPVYLARFLPGAGERYDLASEGPLVRLTEKLADRQGQIQEQEPNPSAEHMLGWRLDDDLVLVSYATALTDDLLVDSVYNLGRGETLGLTLWWGVEREVSVDVKARLSLVSDTGHRWYSTPWQTPVQGMYPAWLWNPGQQVSDYREMEIPRDIPPQSYTLYIDAAPTNSPVQSKAIAKVKVDYDHQQLADKTIESSTAVINDQLALTGFKVVSPVTAGSTSHMQLLWRTIAPPTENYVLRWELLDEAGVSLGQDDVQVFAGEWPTSQWSAATSYLTTVPLAVPSTVSSGQYQLILQIIDEAGNPQTIRAMWPFNAQDRLSLGFIEILPSQAQGQDTGSLTNFDNRAILLQHQLNKEGVEADSTLQVTLWWRCASPMNRDYTVFLHLLDSTGTVRAQIDRYPVQGTRPTSQWRQGETLIDVYDLALPSDLPTGEYQLEVGLYLGATMERLPVVDNNLEPVSDHVILGTIEINK